MDIPYSREKMPCATLQNLITLLSENHRFHISINDISGVLNNSLLRLDFPACIHSKPLCSAAKRTPRGLKVCLTCKAFATRKVIRSGQEFDGICPLGLYEITRPVILGGRTLCVLSIGNLVRDRAETQERIRRTCLHTGIAPQTLYPLLLETEAFENAGHYRAILDMVESYLRLIDMSGSGKCAPLAPSHWAVDRVQQYVTVYYDTHITLTQLARLYYVNSKYLGRLFKRQTGITFRAYLNGVRLEQAVSQLTDTKRKIIDIAELVGFESITYFNRVFRARFGMTPGEYRKRMSH